AVEQVFALQIDIAGQIAAAGERRGPPRIAREKRIQLGRKRGVLLRVEERRLELLERGNQDFRHIAAAEAAEAAVQAHARSRSRERGRSASKRLAIFCGDLRPGRSSTAEPTSIA